MLEVKREGADWQVFWSAEPLDLVIEDALTLRATSDVEAVRMTSVGEAR